VLVTAPEWPGGGTFQGHEEVRQFLAEFEDAWANIRLEYRDAEVIRDAVFCPARWVAEGAASGIEGRLDFFMVAFLRGEKLARMDAFFGREEALERAGRGEQG
jgi:hypothetical protein